MTDTQSDGYWIDLGRRAVACSRWRWMPGMLAHRLDAFDREWARILSVSHSSLRYEEATARSYGGETIRMEAGEFRSENVPDFRDPATLGCLLALVRERFRGACAVVDSCPTAEFWCVDHYEAPGGWWPTEAEALVAALEVAP